MVEQTATEIASQNDVGVWHPEPGDKLQGEVTKRISDPLGGPDLYAVDTADHQIALPPTDRLMNQLSDVEIGDIVRVIFDGIDRYRVAVVHGDEL